MAPGRMASGTEVTCKCSSGLPTVVARRSLPDAANLVGRRVASGQEAQQAASDGASLLLVEVRTPQENLATLLRPLWPLQPAHEGGIKSRDAQMQAHGSTVLLAFSSEHFDTVWYHGIVPR